MSSSNVVFVDFKPTTPARKTADDWYAEGSALDEITERLDEALACYETALLFDPRHIRARVNYGVVLLRLNRCVEAKKQFKVSLQQDSEHYEANYNLGCVLSEGKQYRQAIQYLLKAVALRPDEADCRYNLAYSYYKLGNDALARQAFSAFLKCAPNDDFAPNAKEILRSLRRGLCVVR